MKGTAPEVAEEGGAAPEVAERRDAGAILAKCLDAATEEGRDAEFLEESDAAPTAITVEMKDAETLAGKEDATATAPLGNKETLEVVAKVKKAPGPVKKSRTFSQEARFFSQEDKFFSQEARFFSQEARSFS